MSLLLIIFAQFLRPKLPERFAARDWNLHRYEVPLRMDTQGRGTIIYAKLFPAKYDGKTAIAVCGPVHDPTNKTDMDTPIYVVHEDYEHLTMRSTPGYTLHYVCNVAIKKGTQP